MKRIALSAVALVLLFATPSHAGRIFGDIKLDGKPVPEGVPVRVARAVAENKTLPADSTQTDKFGSYKVTVKETGKCVLAVVFEKQVLTMTVFSYKEATRYDLIVERKDGKLSLRRK